MKPGLALLKSTGNCLKRPQSTLNLFIWILDTWFFFKILIRCVVPIDGFVNHFNKGHKGLMWNIYHNIKINFCNLLLEQLRSCVINSWHGKNKTIPYWKLIVVVLMKTPLTEALEEIGGKIKDEHLVFSSDPLFNITSSRCGLLLPRTTSTNGEKFIDSLGSQVGPRYFLLRWRFICSSFWRKQ